MIIDNLNEILNNTDTHTTMHVFCAYIKKHIFDIAHMSIEQVAKECYISKGQISKCARKLGYSSYLEFKDACVDYSHSISDKSLYFSKENDLLQNTKNFSMQISQTINYVSQNINYSCLNHIINDLIGSSRIYLYAQGDNRSLCNVIQVELSLYTSIVICDADFIKDYQFKDDELLLILSTNATIFRLNRRVIKRIMDAPVKTWLITCKKNMEFSKNILVVPSCNEKYNKFAIRYVVDILIASMQFTFYPKNYEE